MANTHPIPLSRLADVVERLPDAAEEERFRITLAPPAMESGSPTVEAEGAQSESQRTEFDRSGDGEAWIYKGEVLLDGDAAERSDEPGLAHAIRAQLGARCEEVEVASVDGHRASVRVRFGGAPVEGDTDEDPEG